MSASCGGRAGEVSLEFLQLPQLKRLQVTLEDAKGILAGELGLSPKVPGARTGQAAVVSAGAVRPHLGQ